MHIVIVGIRSSTTVKSITDAVASKGITLSEISPGASLEETLRAVESADALVVDSDFASSATAFPSRKAFIVGYVVGYALARNKSVIGLGWSYSDVPLLEESVFMARDLNKLIKAIICLQ